MKTQTLDKGLTTGTGIRYDMGKNRMILGQFKVEILEINYKKREIRMLVHSTFSPQDIKDKPEALAAVERQRDAACRYLTEEGFLVRGKPCTSSRQWCVRAGVIHRPHDKS